MIVFLKSSFWKIILFSTQSFNTLRWGLLNIVIVIILTNYDILIILLLLFLLFLFSLPGSFSVLVIFVIIFLIADDLHPMINIIIFDLLF